MFATLKAAVCGTHRHARRQALAAITATTLALGLTPGHAQEFPSKPVRIVVPNPPGGASDVLARLVAQRLSQDWGQTVLVENRAGANGNIGAALVAKSEPDGLNLLLMDASSLASSPALYPDLTYSPLKDLAPVALVAYSPHILVVRKDLPANTLAELAAHAKANPDTLSFGQTPGSITHLAGVLLSEQLGFTWTPIGYKGGSQVLTDLAGGQIDAALNSYLATYPMVKNGSIKLLAVASAEPFSPIPDVPTIAQDVPGFVTGSWQGLFAPAGTPPALVEKIHADVARVLALPEVQERLAELGSESVEMTPTQFATWMQEQADYWGKVVSDNDIKLM